jgi:anti-anti-sigma regulatory factor
MVVGLLMPVQPEESNLTDDASMLKWGACVGGLYLGFHGGATYRVVPAAEQLVSDFIAAHSDHPVIVLRLAECGWIDSTFAGWMLRLRRRLADLTGARLVLSDCPPDCRATLDTMGVVRLFEFGSIAEPGQTWSMSVSGSDSDDVPMLDLMLRAHEELAGATPDSRRVFEPIAEMLRRQKAAH